MKVRAKWRRYIPQSVEFVCIGTFDEISVSIKTETQKMYLCVLSLRQSRINPFSVHRFHLQIRWQLLDNLRVPITQGVKCKNVSSVEEVSRGIPSDWFNFYLARSTSLPRSKSSICGSKKSWQSPILFDLAWAMNNRVGSLGRSFWMSTGGSLMTCSGSYMIARYQCKLSE